MQYCFHRNASRAAWTLPLRALLCGVLLTLVSLSAYAAPTIEEPAPPLKGTLFDGTPFDLSDYKGKVVMLNFFSSFCKICALEIGNVSLAVNGTRHAATVALTPKTRVLPL